MHFSLSTRSCRPAACRTASLQEVLGLCHLTAGIDRVPPTYLNAKRETLESFLAFADGKGHPAWPMEVFIEVSNICDLQCAMCPTFSALNVERFFALKREDRGVIAFETATQPLDEVLKHALVIHASGYGEPTIHPQYRELLDHLAQYEALIDFFTNGMHLDPDFCDFLVERRIHRVSISFSGANAEEYENIYIGGNFERVLGGIRQLADAKRKAGSTFPRIEINSLAFKHHIEQLPAFVRMMGEAGVNVIHIKPLRTYEKNIAELKHHESHMHPGREELILQEAQQVAKLVGVHLASAPYEATRKHAANFTQAFESLPPDEAKALYQQVEAERIPVSQIKAIALSADKRDEKKQIATSDRQIRPRTVHPSEPEDFFEFKGVPCLEPFKTLYATFDGRVNTCCFLESKDWIGHLDESKAEQIWHNDLYERLREEALQGRYLTSMCQSCLRKGAYPKHHNTHHTFRRYADWFQQAFGEAFLPELQEAILALPANGQIRQRHLQQHPTQKGHTSS